MHQRIAIVMNKSPIEKNVFEPFRSTYTKSEELKSKTQVKIGRKFIFLNYEVIFL